MLHCLSFHDLLMIFYSLRFYTTSLWSTQVLSDLFERSAFYLLTFERVFYIWMFADIGRSETAFNSGTMLTFVDLCLMVHCVLSCSCCQSLE